MNPSIRTLLVLLASASVAACAHGSSNERPNGSGSIAQSTSSGTRIADASISTVINHVKEELLQFGYAYAASGVDLSEPDLVADPSAIPVDASGPCQAYSAPDRLRRGTRMATLTIEQISIKASLSGARGRSGEGGLSIGEGLEIAIGGGGGSNNAASRTFELNFVPHLDDVSFIDRTQVSEDLEAELRAHEIERRAIRDGSQSATDLTLSDFLLEYARELAEIDPTPPCVSAGSVAKKEHKLILSFSIKVERDLEAGLDFFIFEIGSAVSESDAASNTITITFRDNLDRAR